MCPPQTLTKEAEQIELDLGQPIKFESVQLAAEWLKGKAARSGVDQAVIDDIEAIGTCDEQSRAKIERYCAELDLNSSAFTW